MNILQQETITTAKILAAETAESRSKATTATAITTATTIHVAVAAAVETVTTGRAVVRIITTAISRSVFKMLSPDTSRQLNKLPGFFIECQFRSCQGELVEPEVVLLKPAFDKLRLTLF
jgi:hypothetical protein